tara:strand:+ start:932 stop:1711 length:780 start_codon:yes stop_codon:yes gene_type:complete
MTNEWFKSLVEKTGKKYLSYSSIKYALQDMALFELYMQGKLKKESDALTFGTAYDCLLFTPHEFDNTFHVMDDTEIIQDLGGKNPRVTKAYKEWKVAQEELAKDKTILGIEDYQKCIDMITRLDDSKILNIYLDGDYQVEFLQRLEINGETIPFRGFLDCLGKGFISDSKSSRSIKGFPRDVRVFGYDIQAFLYTRAFGCKDFYWVVQEKSYPYLPAVYKATEDTLASGERKVARALSEIKRHYESGKSTSTYFIQGEI